MPDNQSTKKTNKESTFAEQVKAERERLGLTQTELAKRWGFTRSYLSQIETGDAQPGPRLRKQLIASERSAYVGSMSTYASSVREDIIPNEQISVASVRMVPLVSSAQAGLASVYEEVPESWQEKVPTTSTDPKTFAVTVRGDSMEPNYREGDIAFLLPSSAARNGDLVVASIKEEGFALKIMTLIGGDPERVRLTSYNIVYPPMDLRREQFHWIYPVHSVTKLVWRK
jgi:phage repressor protein C with HTH and peptisase S24 domain